MGIVVGGVSGVEAQSLKGLRMSLGLKGSESVGRRDRLKSRMGRFGLWRMDFGSGLLGLEFEPGDTIGDQDWSQRGSQGS